MSRFERRLKGTNMSTRASLPGNSSCNLPKSSESKGAMLRGMNINLPKKYNNINNKKFLNIIDKLDKRCDKLEKNNNIIKQELFKLKKSQNSIMAILAVNSESVETITSDLHQSIAKNNKI